MSDRREEILSGYQTVIPESDVECVSKEDAKDAMDDYMKECCLELLGYMAKNNITLSIHSTPNAAVFKHKGELLTKEQLFEKFL